MFIAGNEPTGRAVAAGLVGDLGCEAVDAGPLRNARLLEPLAMLWIDLAFKRELGRDFAMFIDKPR